MAKYTVEELFYGDKYGIMGEVVKQVFARQKEFIAAPHTFRKLEIVRQTLIATEKMKKKRLSLIHISEPTRTRRYGHLFYVQRF